MNSSLLDIYTSNGELSQNLIWSIDNIESKLFCIKDLSNNLIFFPLIHSVLN